MPAASDAAIAAGDVLASDLVDDPTRRPHAEPIRALRTAHRRREWGKHASLAAVALGATGGFLALARLIGGGRGTRLDRSLVRGVGRARSPITDALAHGLTFFGSVTGAALVSTATVVAARKRPRLGAQVVTGVLGGALAELVIKRWYERERPTLLAHLERVSSTSFPSGHSMAAAALYLTLGFVASRSRRLRAHRATLLAGGGTFAAAVGASRVFLGVHWPTDVMAGYALGTGWACLTEAAFDLAGAARIEKETLLEQPAANQHAGVD